MLYAEQTHSSICFIHNVNENRFQHLDLYSSIVILFVPGTRRIRKRYTTIKQEIFLCPKNITTCSRSFP